MKIIEAAATTADANGGPEKSDAIAPIIGAALPRFKSKGTHVTGAGVCSADSIWST